FFSNRRRTPRQFRSDLARRRRPATLSSSRPSTLSGPSPLHRSRSCSTRSLGPCWSERAPRSWASTSRRHIPTTSHACRSGKASACSWCSPGSRALRLTMLIALRWQAIGGGPATWPRGWVQICAAPKRHFALRPPPDRAFGDDALLVHPFRKGNDRVEVDRDVAHGFERGLQLRRHRPILAEPALGPRAISGRLDFQELLRQLRDGVGHLRVIDDVPSRSVAPDRALLH